MKRILLLFAMLFIAVIYTANAQVIISQVYEGTSYNKFIEITNLGPTPVDLTNPQFTIKTFNNKTEIGSNTPTYTKNLTGTLAPGQCLLIRHKDAAAPAYAVSYTPSDTSMVANFNGEGPSSNPTSATDIVALYNGTTLVDVFAWGTFQYKDKSYYRNLSVTMPNPTWTETEWTLATLATVDGAAANTVERLGYHSAVATNPALFITSPANNSTVYSANVDITFSVYNFVIGTDGHIHYTVDGGAANEHNSTSPISLTGLSEDTHTVVLTLVDNNHNPLSPNVSASVTFTVDLSGPSITRIYDIQYTTDPSGDSPLKDQVVTTTGIVTASYASGYFIQDGTTPWNGLFVYDNTHSPALGDSIVLTGTVAEYYNYTELKNIIYYNTIATGKPLPLPLNLNTLSVKNEQYEGMLVKLTNAVCTYVHSSGWWKVVQNVTDTCEIGKMMFPYPSAVVGTAYVITGLVNYSFGAFKVEPRDINDIEIFTGINNIQENTVTIHPNPAQDFITVSNIENYDVLKISNLLGELVYSLKINNAKHTVNISDLNKGIYFISLIKDGKTTITQKFVKL